MNNLFWDSSEAFFRTFILTILAYFTIVFFIRISGKRTLSKMNAFDFIVTIALGSCLATVALNKKVPLAEGALVFFLLIFLQFILTWSSVRIPAVKKLITSKPVLILFRGEPLDKEMKRQRISIDEVWLAARKEGIGDLSEIDAVVLETTGELTVIAELKNINSGTLTDVKKV